MKKMKNNMWSEVEVCESIFFLNKIQRHWRVVENEIFY